LGKRTQLLGGRSSNLGREKDSDKRKSGREGFGLKKGLRKPGGGTMTGEKEYPVFIRDLQ